MNRPPGYNAKARGSVAGSSKKRKRSTRDADEIKADPNADIYVPKSEKEKDIDRKEKLLQEVGWTDIRLLPRLN